MARTRILFGLAAAFCYLGAAGSPAVAEDSVREKALKLNDLTGADAINGKIEELIKDKAALKKLVAEAAKMVKEKEQPFNYNGAMILAKASISAKDYDTSLAFFKVCQKDAFKLKSSQKLLEVYPTLTALQMVTKKYEDAVKTCEEFLELGIKGDTDAIRGATLKIVVTRIEAIAGQKKFDDAIKATDALIERNEGGWYFLKLKADILRQAGKLDESIGIYEDTIERIGKADLDEKDRDSLVDGCRYAMTGVYTDLGKTDKCIEILRTLLKSNPDSSTYNNDLGYVLADNDKSLDEAETLVRKALELDKTQRAKLKEDGLIDDDEDKENAAYLDSLGWVLFKKKSYAEAKKCLVEATKSDEGKHVEIFDHLGDVHKAMGEKTEAVAVWQKALDLENVTKRDDARKEAIKKKMAEEAGANP